MEVVESVFCGVLQRFLLWIRRRTQLHSVSRDFWMPDESCRVCYECEVPFSFFNRRHHCRICGRIFCAKCTQNTVPSIDIHPNVSCEGCHVRACNFCFKLKQDDEHKSNSGNFASANYATRNSAPQSEGKFHSPHGSSGTDGINNITEKNQIVHQEDESFGLVLPREREMSPNPYDFCSNRSGEEETDDAKNELLTSTWTLRCQQNQGEEDDGIEKSVTVCNSISESLITKSPSYTNQDFDIHGESRFQESTVEMVTTPQVERNMSKNSTMSSDDYEVLDESLDESNFYAPSLLPSSTLESHDVDVENNMSIWVPPPPQDEADERSMYLVDDDDDDDEIGWGNLTSSEYRIQEKATALQDRRRAMRAVVDGHFRALVAQLLEAESLDAYESEGLEKNGWLEIVSSLATQAAKLIKPDTSKGGGMDPGGYVKVRCIASGLRSDSRIVKGVVCKRNVAHRRMPSYYNRPKLLLLGGALEYQRIPNMLSSLDTLLQQEKEHISMTVSRIEAHHPNVVLVEKNVSGQAQEILLSKGIALVLNVKRPLLEHIARCTGAEVVPAPDHLMRAKSGYCDLFHVEKFIEELGTAGQARQPSARTLMFFEGCPRPLGCTVLLKGASGDELKKVKRVIQFAVFAAYQLALETSFLVDEGADLSLKSPISVALPDNHSKFDRSITTVPRLLLPDSGPLPTVGFQNQSVSSFLEHDMPMNMPSWSNVNINVNGAIVSTPFSINSSSFSSQNISPSTSPRVIDDQKARDKVFSSNQICLTKSTFTLQDPKDFRLPNGETSSKLMDGGKHDVNVGFRNMSNTHGCRLKPRRSASNVSEFTQGEASSEMREVDSDLGYAYQRSKSMASSLALSTMKEQDSNQEEFLPSPSDQSILVLFSSICLRKRVVCQRGHLFRIKYYGSFDKPLGKFLKDNVFDPNNGCGACGEMRDAHIHCYMHQQGSLIISVHRQGQVLPGEGEEKIWMWHRCLICPRVNNVPPATHRVLMSDAAWGLSFGKFLELSFSNHAAAGRVAACGHSLHRDCLRFYGFGDMIACFRYGSINVHTVCLPPAKLEFNNLELDEWLRMEVHEVEKKAYGIFTKAYRTLCAIEGKLSCYGVTKSPEGRRCILEFVRLLKVDHKAFLEVMQSAAPIARESGHPYADILQLNAARRLLATFSYAWNEQFNIFLKLQQMSLINSSANLEEPLTPMKTKDTSFQYKNSCGVDSGHEISNPISNTVSKSKELVGVHLSDITHQQRISFEESLHLDNQISGGMGNYETNHLSDCEVNGNSSTIAFHDFQELYGRNKSFSKIIESIDEGSVGSDSRLFSSKSAIQFNLQESEILVQRTCSEGGFPSLPDLPHTFETAWTGEGHTIEAHTVNISSTGQEIFSQGSGIGRSASVHDLATVLNTETTSGSTPDLGGHNLSDVSWVGSDIVSSTPRLYKNSSSISETTVMSATPSHLIYSSYSSEGHLLLPVGIHNTVIPVYDSEPTSIIAYAIMSHQYHAHLSDGPLEKDKFTALDKEMQAKHENFDLDMSSVESVLSHPLQSTEGSLDKSNLVNEASYTGLRENGNLQYSKATHVKVVFTDEEPSGKVKYMVTCYYAKRFDTLRKTCCSDEMDFIRSLCRCKKWGAQGGKSNVFFAKTKDDRLVIKQVTKTELESFIKFAPEYFKYVSESLKSGSPTCLAKILGIFQVSVKHAKGGREVRTDLMVMENLLYGRHINRVYDLKGSLRSRYNSDKTGKNKVLLDENLVESMLTNPLFIGNKAKRLLERAVWNDTSFLASVDVMDYSLLVGVDEMRGELVLGIIDFMRQYTWDKHLETWVKASGILGGPKNAQPTVISPKQYKKRFRKAMQNYFLMVPDQWSPTMEIFCPPSHADSVESFQSVS